MRRLWLETFRRSSRENSSACCVPRDVRSIAKARAITGCIAERLRAGNASFRSIWAQGSSHRFTSYAFCGNSASVMQRSRISSDQQFSTARAVRNERRTQSLCQAVTQSRCDQLKTNGSLSSTWSIQSNWFVSSFSLDQTDPAFPRLILLSAIVRSSLIKYSFENNSEKITLGLTDVIQTW